MLIAEYQWYLYHKIFTGLKGGTVEAPAMPIDGL